MFTRLNLAPTTQEILRVKTLRVNWRAFTVDTLYRKLTVKASSIGYAEHHFIEVNGKRERKTFCLTVETRDEAGEVLAWELEHFESGWYIEVTNE